MNEPIMGPGPVAPLPSPDTLTMGESIDIRENLNLAISRWGKKLGGAVSIRAMKILGRLNDGTKEFDEKRKEGFEKFGKDEIKSIPAELDETGKEIEPAREEPTGNRVIDPTKVKDYGEFIQPFLDADSEIPKSLVFGRFTEAEFEGFAPSNPDDPLEYEQFVQTLYSLRELVKD